MTTSQDSWLCKPIDGTRVPLAAQGYMRARNQYLMHALILNEFQKAGISQAELARRTGRRTDTMCRLLGSPGNWTLNTISDLIFAMGGGEPAYSVSYPLEQPLLNDTKPHWLINDEFTASSSVRTSNTYIQQVDQQPA